MPDNQSVIRDPNHSLPLRFDWGTDWMPEGDSLYTATFTVEAGLTKGAVTTSGDVATVITSGGVHGENYAVTCHITTIDGLEDDWTVDVRVREQ